LGGRKGIRPVKNMGDGGGGHWLLVQMEWRPSGWSMCLPLLIFPCTIKSRSSLLAPDHPADPGKKAVKLGFLLIFLFSRTEPSPYIVRVAHVYYNAGGFLLQRDAADHLECDVQQPARSDTEGSVGAEQAHCPLQQRQDDEVA